MLNKVTRFACLALLLCASGLAHAEGLVTLRSASQVEHAAIRLSDVFDGIAPEKDSEIAIAPAPGKSVTYEVRVLTQLAAQHHLDWKPQGLADRVVLTRAATHITPDMIREAVLSKIKQADPKIDAAQAEVQFDVRFAGLDLPADVQPTFDLANFDYNADTHRFRGEVVPTGAAAQRTQAVIGKVVIKRNVPVLARPLGAGAVIGSSDIAWTTVDDNRVGEDVIMTAEQIVGAELRHNQGEGEYLRLRDIQPLRLVTRGSLVTIKVETPLMLITTQGRVLQDGAKGETVRVVNTQSNRTVEGVVEATGVVRVGAARLMASAK